MNQQINSNLEKDVLALEKESQELLSSIFDVQQLDPPAEIIDAINAEARRYILMRKFNRRLRFMMKTAALAAGIMLVISGGFHINNSHSKLDRHQVVLNQLSIVAGEDGALLNELDESSTATLAELLMQMQGFDEESFFALN